jgi:hypothetical protein
MVRYVSPGEGERKENTALPGYLRYLPTLPEVAGSGGFAGHCVRWSVLYKSNEVNGTNSMAIFDLNEGLGLGSSANNNPFFRPQIKHS